MARDWRRAVLATFAAATLGGACVLVVHVQAHAQSPDQEAEEEQSAKAPEGPKGKKRQDPVEVQNVIDAAAKQLQAGRADQVVQALSGAVAGGNLPPAIMAKALYLRGAAYRRQGRSAQAISDLNAALWLKGGLGGDDRAEAINERAAAYADAGLADPGDSQGSASKAASNSSGNWLSGLFSGFPGASSPPPSPPPAPKAPAPPVERDDPPPPAAKTATSGWTTPQVSEAPRAPAAKAPPPPKVRPPRVQAAKAPPPRAPSEAPTRKAEGRYLVQLAAMRTEAEALALAAKAKRANAALASRGQSVDRTVFGNMGAFFRARFGPFASAQETQAVCAKLQGSGIDCLPIAQ